MAYERHDRRWYAPRVPSGRPVATIQQGLNTPSRPVWVVKQEQTNNCN